MKELARGHKSSRNVGELLPENMASHPGRLYCKKVVKLSLCLIKHYTMKAYGGVDVQLHHS
jgi:hypothetical protein